MTTLVAPAVEPILRFVDGSNLPLIGGTLLTQVGGINYPTYSEATGTVQLPNPIVLNGRGEVATSTGTSSPLFLTQNVTYSFTLSDALGNVIWTDPAVTGAASVANVLTALTQAALGAIANPTSAAELAAGVTPTNFAIAAYPIDPRRYGADNTGATDSTSAWASAISVARKSTGIAGTSARIKVVGQYLVTSLNLASQGAIDFNTGFTMDGDGIHSTSITFTSSTANTGIGMDLGCMAYFKFSGIRFNFGTSTANAPKVGILLSKGNYSGTVFSGIGQFVQCLFAGYGSYSVYDQSAEQIDFNNCQNIALASLNTPYWFSRANTPAITSPNFVMASPGDSMTDISFSGSQSTILASGAQGIMWDIGTTTGGAGFDLGTMYFSLTGPTTIAMLDNGGAGSTLQNITSSNIIVEHNGGAGTNQVMVISAPIVKGFNIKGTSAYTAPTQLVPHFVFGNPLYSSYINWNGNDAGAQPATVISGSQAYGCIFQVAGPASSVVFSGGGQLSIFANDYAQGTYGASSYTQPISTIPGYGDATIYTLATFKGGVRTSFSADGGIRRGTHANVSTTVGIYSGLSFGELMTVTGTTTGGNVFADLLMVGYNSVTVISSNTQAGSPSARNYSIASGTLQLAMTSGTYNVIVQSIITGSQQ